MTAISFPIPGAAISSIANEAIDPYLLVVAGSVPSGENLVGVNLPSGANSSQTLLGATLFGAASGSHIGVTIAGVAICKASAAISAGAKLGFAAGGKVKTYASGTVVGEALTAAAADGDLISVMLATGPTGATGATGATGPTGP